MSPRSLLFFSLVCFSLGLSAWAEAPPSDVFRDIVARVPGGGAGLVVSADGTVVMPVSALGSRERLGLEVGGRTVQASLAFKASNKGFVVLQLPAGDYFSPVLGDFSTLQEGDTVGTQDGNSVVSDIQADLSTNEQYAVLDSPYRGELLGTPVFDSNSNAIGLIVGPGPQGPSQCRAVSSSAIKVILFEAGWKPVKPRVHPLLPGGQAAATPVEEWDFPFGREGETRTGALLMLEEWRYNTGTQGGTLAPLALDQAGRLYLVTLQGTAYCLDFARRQMLWRTELDPGGVVLVAPIAAPSGLFVASGGLGLFSFAQRRTGLLMPDLFQDIAGRADQSLGLNFGRLYALNTQGNESWTLPSRFPSGPLLSQGTVFFSGLGLMGAVESASGKVRWLKQGRQSKSEAVWYTLQAVEGNRLYGLSVPVEVHGGLESSERIHLKGGGVVTAFALDANSGRELWAQKLERTETAVRPLGMRLDLSGDSLHVTLADERIGLSPESGKTLYRHSRGDRALLDRVACAEGVFFGADQDSFYALEPTSEKLLWRQPLAGAVAAPLWHEGVVYGIFHHSVVALEPRTGQKLWEHSTENRLSGRPVAGGGYLYCASPEGKIIRFRLSEGI